MGRNMADDLEEEDDFEEGEGAEQPAPSSSKKLPLKKILIIAVPLLLFIGVGAGLYLTGIIPNLMKKGGAESHEAADKPTDPSQVAPAVFMDLPEMLVNLQTQGAKRQSFLKIRVALELEAATDMPRVDQMMPRIIDTFQVYLRELRVEDLQGAYGMTRLREELLNRVLAAVKPVKVNDVLFREMLIQ